MTRHWHTLALVALLVGAASPARAQENSVTQMALVSSTQFLNRIQFLGWQVAREVLAEDHDGSAGDPLAYDEACHEFRASFARNFIVSPASLAAVTAVGVAGTNQSGAVLLGTVTGSGATADSSVNDTVLSQAIRWNYNALAGCDTGS